MLIGVNAQRHGAEKGMGSFDREPWVHRAPLSHHRVRGNSLSGDCAKCPIRWLQLEVSLEKIQPKGFYHFEKLPGVSMAKIKVMLETLQNHSFIFTVVPKHLEDTVAGMVLLLLRNDRHGRDWTRTCEITTTKPLLRCNSWNLESSDFTNSPCEGTKQTPFRVPSTFRGCSTWSVGQLNP